MKRITINPGKMNEEKPSIKRCGVLTSERIGTMFNEEACVRPWVPAWLLNAMDGVRLAFTKYHNLDMIEVVLDELGKWKAKMWVF